MKRKSKRFILSLILGSSLLLSSCGGNPGGESSDSGSDGNPGGESEIVIPEPTDIPEDIPEPTESDIDPEQGVDEDTKDTLAEVLELFKNPMTLEQFDKIVTDYSIEHKMSNKVADGVLKVIIYLYQQIYSRGSPTISNIDYIDNLFQVAKEIRLVDMFYALQYFFNVLAGVEEITYNEFDYMDYRINSVKHSDIDRLEKIAAQSNDAGFVATVDQYKQTFDNLYIDPSFEDWNMGSGRGFFVPDTAIEMMDKLSETDQLGIVRMWEQLVSVLTKERIGEFLESIIEMSSGKGSMYINDKAILKDGIKESFIYLSRYLLDPTAIAERQLPEVLNMLTLRDLRAVVSVLLKDEKNAGTLLSTATSFVLPAIVAAYEDSQTPEAKAALSGFINSLKTLNGSNIAVIGRLLDNLLGLFTEDEFIAIKGHIAEGNFTSLFTFVVQKKNGVANLINGLSVTDKSLISGISTVLGYDFNSFLSLVATNIVKVVSLEDEESEKALNNIMNAARELAGAVMRKVGPAFDFGANEDYYADFYYASTNYIDIAKGATQEELKNAVAAARPYFYIYRMGSESRYSFSYDDIPQGFSVEVSGDTSKAGISGVVFTITIQDVEVLTKKTPLRVYDVVSGDLIAVSTNEASPFYEQDFLSSYHTAVDDTSLYSQFDKFVDSDAGGVTFDVTHRQNGWNIFKGSYVNKEGQTKTVYTPYFYIGFDSIEDYVTTKIEYHFGGYVNENLNVSGRSYVKVTTIVRNFEVYKDKEVTASDSAIGGEEIPFLPYSFSEKGTYTIISEGKNYIFHIIEANNSVLGQYSFEFDISSIIDEETASYSAESLNGKLHKVYYDNVDFTVDGMMKNIPLSFETIVEVTVSNFSYSGSLLEFDYEEYHFLGQSWY